MIKNEDYILLLKSMISCVNNGDYYSIKELSHLKLEQIEEKERKIKKQIRNQTKKFKLKNLKNIKMEDLKKEEILMIIKLYSQYILKTIENINIIEELQNVTISIEEFMKKCVI